ncbi:HAD family hydrolase [Filimonas effusa]|uniref:Haloacid dehalogenase-like hydrolase n=1 Tax=Filimonas effusa TaxID=2508721 RepID=A0A4Q1D938_9BACT|nr:HAD family hydrolase [Filimonas effusa]RXK85328.1 haloacid dehalogenase-like hydrolase [Filimonas effusa]
MTKRKLVAFDFDGTITNKDTFLSFIRFVKGNKAFYLGFAKHILPIIGFKAGLYPNWKAKQLVFSHFFKGMNYQEFQEYGNKFSIEIEKMIRPAAREAIRTAVREADAVYVITASVEDWVKPWCNQNGISLVLGTTVEVDADGKLTGRFSCANCYGQEKVNRLLLKEPDRSSYTLQSFGDSKGDKQLIAFSDEGWLNKFV